MRVVIAGAPRCGKSTLFRSLALEFDVTLATDDYIHLGWDAVPDAAVAELAQHESWLLEGVAAARVLRRWLLHRGDCPKIDVCYYLTKPMAQRTRAHDSMAKGIEKVWREVAPKLIASGCQIVREVPRG